MVKSVIVAIIKFNEWAISLPYESLVGQVTASKAQMNKQLK